jgi:mannan endo-1,4-beta-mannosidase
MSYPLSRRQLLRIGLIATGSTLFGAPALSRPRFAAPLRAPRRYRGSITTFRTIGRFLYSPNGTKVILRGVNLPVLDDWGFPQSSPLTELVKTGANAVRIQWYKNYGQASRPAYSVADLDRLLTQCKNNNIIPIVYLSDLTCQSDPSRLSELMPWWTDSEVVAILKKHQQYLIINLANELGHYRWSGNSSAALNSYKTAYKSAIAQMRQAGVMVPIAIDAPDCGSSIEVFPAIAQELIAADLAKNLLFSGHAYWAAYDGIPQIQAAINANVPLFFGEIANLQDEYLNGRTEYGYYDLAGTAGAPRPAQNGFTYQNLLTFLKSQEIGWLAWSWWKDLAPQRQMTLDGTFANLTPYGRDLVTNAIYGLQATATKISL